MDFLNNSAWMRAPVFRMTLIVLLAAMPSITGDLSAGKFSWLTVCVASTSMLIAAKAFISDPNEVAKPKPPA